ncbi:MAG: tRNA pseudouridine(55) synthase TruB [Myxococcota bacterium]
MSRSEPRAAHGVLVLDKPAGPTSHDVVARVRRALGTRSVGHAGTLDPMATGVLVVAVGEGTKLVAYLTADDKEYEAEVTLGTATSTLDAAGETTEAVEVPRLTEGDVDRVLGRFVGCLWQQAPMVSAIKVRGRALHARVRRGEQVEPAVREVRVHRLQRLAFDGRRIRLRVHCGKGFYVRSLARDLGHALGTVAHLSALRRLRSGVFGLAGALPFDVVQRAADGEVEARDTLLAALQPLEQACRALPCLQLTPEGAADARHGRRIDAARLAGPGAADLPPDATCALLDPDGHLVALARLEGPRLRVVRGIRQT